ncbi:PAS domain S-box protein [Bradyrhizobium sp. ma5]|uniref:sensor histidine kinase n=1 Tax=Bradyrhizobium sp. ma5 TaxID=3344828 RepID=UPI0035D4B981
MSALKQDAGPDAHRLLRQLQAREAELALIHRIAGVGGVEVDLRDGFQNRRSPEYLKIHGLPPTATNESHQDWVARIHPADRTRAEGQFLEALAGRASDYSAEYRIVRPSDGQTRWVRVAAQIDRDATGRPLRLIGAHFDVTDAKFAEQALRESEERFRTIANSAPIPMWVTKLDGERSFVNQAYTEFFELTYEEALRFDWRSRVHPEDAARILKAEQLRTLVPANPVLSRNRFAIEIRILRAGTDWRWIKAVSQPRYDERGQHVGFIGVAHDITSEKQAEIELRASEERFRLMLDSAPVMIWMSDSDGRCVHLNQMLREFWHVSDQEAQGFDWSNTLHPEDRPNVVGRVSLALEERSGFALKARYLDASGHYRILDTSAHPRFSASGEFVGMIGANVDVTERDEAERARELLVDELNHRVKNTLAIVQAIAHQTFRNNADPVEARHAFEGRLIALGRAHDLLTKANWENASLADLTEATLDARGVNADRISLDGPRVLLTPKQAVSIAMALHELRTNATKYGALSNEAGLVRVEWNWTSDARPQLRIVWRESGGPAVSRPTRRGFGSTLLERTLAHDLDGEVSVQFDPGGLLCRIAVPLDGSQD